MKDWIVLVVLSVLLAGTVAVLFTKIITLGDAQDDYSIICLGGFKYYKADFLAKGFITVVLDNEGKPTKCEALR